MSIKVNKEFFIFFFFLCLSGVFWLFMALSETYDREIDITVRVTNVPSGVVMTSPEEETVQATVRDKGYFMASYIYGNAIRPIEIDYANHAKTGESLTVTSAELQKALQRQLYGSTEIIALKPDNCKFYYTKGESKEVPVELNGKIQAAGNHYLAKVYFTPGSVSAYASESFIDSVTEAQTELLSVLNVTDTVTQTVSLRTSPGVKFVPATVNLTICTDILIEETVDVPVTAVNVPAGKTLRTFPSKVSVSYTIGASMFRDMDAGQFVVQADYNEIAVNPSEKCRVYLRQMPDNVRGASLTVEQVDYLIEEAGIPETRKE